MPDCMECTLADAVTLHHGGVCIASCKFCQEGLLLFGGGELMGVVSHGRGRVTVHYLGVRVRVEGWG